MAVHSNQYQEKPDMFTLCQLLLCVKNTDERIILFIKESLCKPAKLKAEHAYSMVLLLHKSVCVCVDTSHQFHKLDAISRIFNNINIIAYHSKFNKCYTG